MSNRVVYFEVIGKDAAKLQIFYSGLFDRTINSAKPIQNGEVTETDAGIRGAIGQTDRGAGYVTFYVAVDNLKATLNTARTLGGRVVMEPTAIEPGVHIAQLEDPEGHLIGLVENERPT